MTAEQLEAARTERMRQNGHGAIAFEDVRTWVEETGLCVYLPRPTQAGQIHSSATPSFIEAVAGHRTPDPTLELIKTAESLLVRLESDGVAVRLNLAGLPGEQPDYIVAAWVLPYIYALRGDRDWRRSPQLTGSRQVSPLAVQAAKHLEPANLTATQLRDQLGKEVTEAAVLRALHELWKQLRVIPVVPHTGSPALWQPLRQRFQKAIAEGASTSQVTAISVLASIYLQAVIAASMEEIELFLSPLTSRSKIREVVRGLAATRQVHTTAMGHASLYYVAGTLPEFPVVPSYAASAVAGGYRSSYLPSYIDDVPDEDFAGSGVSMAAEAVSLSAAAASHGHQKTWEAKLDVEPVTVPLIVPESLVMELVPEPVIEPVRHVSTTAHPVAHAGKTPVAGKVPAPRPRPARSAATSHPRERSRGERSEGRSGNRSGNGEWRRPPAPRGTASANGSRPGAASHATRSLSEGNGRHAGKPARNGHASNGHGSNGNGAHRPASGSKQSAQSWSSRPAANGNGHVTNGNRHATNGSRPAANGNRHAANGNGAKHGPANGTGRTAGNAAGRNGNSASSGAKHRVGANSGAKPAARSGNGHRPETRVGTVAGRSGSRPVAGKGAKPGSGSRKPAVSASKRYSFAGQAKQAPKAASKSAAGRSAKGKPAASRGKSARPAATAKRRG